MAIKQNQQIFRWMSSFTKSDIDKVFLNNFKEKLLKGEDVINFLGNNTIDKKINS